MLTPDDPLAPQVGDMIWAGRYSRRLVSIDEVMEDGRWRVHTYDDKLDEIVQMAITFKEPVAATGRGSRRAKIERPKLTPQLRLDIANGARCRARAHDMLATLPNGKAGMYMSPAGSQACRWCKQEAAERHFAKVAAAAEVVE